MYYYVLLSYSDFIKNVLLYGLCLPVGKKIILSVSFKGLLQSVTIVNIYVCEGVKMQSGNVRLAAEDSQGGIYHNPS